MFLPAPGRELSTITDFNGTIGVAEGGGTGIGTDAKGVNTNLVYACDLRFMRGYYIGVDGDQHVGAFAFI